MKNANFSGKNKFWGFNKIKKPYKIRLIFGLGEEI
jgi:hypothetical protein